ncbi:hypothetical protein [Marinisporobacter balticus]|nr:hypothetical protein [Marinisporobacter balticus]
MAIKMPILDELVANNEKVAHIESLYVGDMTYEECEVSWIEQGNYSELIAALPNLKHLTIKGSNGLSLTNLNHQKLESLEIASQCKQNIGHTTDMPVE